MLLRAVNAAAPVSIAAPSLPSRKTPTGQPQGRRFHHHGLQICQRPGTTSGETALPHPRFCGAQHSRRDCQRRIAVAGQYRTGADRLRPTLADERSKGDRLLVLGRYFIIIPDALGPRWLEQAFRSRLFWVSG